MLSKLPIDLEGKDVDKEMLRFAIIAEFDAINLYEQMAAKTDDNSLRKMFLDVAKEEKTHVGEFQALLLNRDAEQVKELKAGREEVKEETGE